MREEVYEKNLPLGAVCIECSQCPINTDCDVCEFWETPNESKASVSWKQPVSIACW